MFSRHRTGSTFGFSDLIRPLGLYTRPLHDCPIAQLTSRTSESAPEKFDLWLCKSDIKGADQNQAQ